MTPEDRQRLQELIAEMRQPESRPRDYWGVPWADRLDALVRAGGAETPPEVHADRFMDCGHWKCDEVLKHHPELRVETPAQEPRGRSDKYYLAMAALDNYPIDDGLPKSTSVVFRIHQLGHALEALRSAPSSPPPAMPQEK